MYEILVTNDDGIKSQGLLTLAAALTELGNVIIVAPQTQQTSAGRSIQYKTSTGTIIEETITLNNKPIKTYAVDATPAQVVMHAILEILPKKPDLGISGINFGENSGSCIMTSGTIGAAVEMASSYGIPAIASSLQLPANSADYFTHDPNIDFSTAAYFTAMFAKQVLGKPFPHDVDIFKVEIPFQATKDTAWKTTNLSRVNNYEYRIQREGDWSSHGLATGKPKDYSVVPVEPNSDIDVLMNQKLVTITPLSIDNTSRTPLDQIDSFLRSN